MRKLLLLLFVFIGFFATAQEFDEIYIRETFTLTDSSAIAIITDNDTLATTHWVRDNAMPWDSLDFNMPYNNGYLRWYRLGLLDSTSLDGRYPTFTDLDDSLDLKATQFPGICATTPITSDDITINYTTRVLTITPPLGYFDYFTDGSGVIEKHTVTGAVSFPAFTDISGIWYFYFNSSGTAITTQTAWSNFASIATVYRLLWNATLAGSAKSIVENMETHENTTSWVDHMWKHRYGSIWFTGFDNFNNFLASGTPAVNGVNTVVSFNSGVNLDDNLVYTVANSTGGLDWQQDLGNTTPASLDNTNSAQLTIKYRDATGLIYTLPATRFPFAWDTGTDQPEYITTSGVRTLVSNGDYFVNFVYSIQDPRTGEQLTIVSAPEEFATITGARAYNWADLQGDFPLVNDGEVRPLYKFIHEYKTTYGVTNKYSALREVTDIRKQEVTQGGTLSGTIAASQVTNIPAGDIGSTNQQAVNNELDTEKISSFLDAPDTESSYTPYEFQIANAGGTALESPVGLTYNDSLNVSGNIIADTIKTDDISGTDHVSLHANDKEIARVSSNGVTEQLIINPAGDLTGTASAPSLAFSNNTGFYEQFPNALSIAFGGVKLWAWSSNVFGGTNTGDALILNEVATATNPVHTFLGNELSGLGMSAIGEASLVANSIEAMRLTQDTVFVDSTFAPLQIKFPDGTIQTTAGTGDFTGVMQVVKAEVLYTNTSQTTIITLPTDAIISDVAVEVTTLFDDSGTDLLDVGITTSSDEILANESIALVEFISTGRTTETGTATIPYRLSGGTNITFTYTGQNSDATQGAGYVYIYYITF